MKQLVRFSKTLALCLLPLTLSAPALAASSQPVDAAAATNRQAIPMAPQHIDLKLSTQALHWKPMVLPTVDDIDPGAPPEPDTEATAKEIGELLYLQQSRTKDDLLAIGYWEAEPSPLRWGEEARNQIITASLPPTLGSRALAIMHVAIYDAALAAWKAKAKYRRPGPALALAGLRPLDAVAGDKNVPSYPSEDAAIAAAASTTLAALFPDQAAELKKKAMLEGEARIVAGANFRSDVDAGTRIGNEVARRILAYAKTDGSDKLPKLPLPYKPGQWHTAVPMTPLAGNWRTWLLKDGAQFTLNPPPVGSPTFKKAASEVFEVHKHLTQHQIERAVYWNFDVPAILWEDIVRRSVAMHKLPAKPDPMNIRWTDMGLQSAKNHRLDTLHTARMLGLLHMTMADSFITTWNTKYRVLEPRPYMVAPKDHPFLPLVNTPVHPSFPSAHASGSAAAAVILSHYFPDEAKYYDQQAKEAAMSRLWGGIHYRFDNDEGLELGRMIGKYAADEAKANGWFDN